MSFQRFATAIIVVLFVSFSAHATSIVDVRLSQQDYDKSSSSLYVNIEVRVDNAEQLILAGQNYRIYYPTETLSLNKKGSKSQLSPEKYTDLKWASVLENVSAQGEGLIKFDKNLGFANFSLELIDNKEGGEKLTEDGGWMTIATLKFDVIDNFDEVSMLWGRESLSADYATAFVEIAEWTAPLVTKQVEIDEYIDFNLEINQLSLDGSSYDLSVGPNPAIDFVEFRTDKALDSDASVIIRDISGKLIRTETLRKGSKHYSIDVTSLVSSTYMMELTDDAGSLLHTQKIVVAR